MDAFTEIFFGQRSRADWLNPLPNLNLEILQTDCSSV